MNDAPLLLDISCALGTMTPSSQKQIRFGARHPCTCRFRPHPAKQSNHVQRRARSIASSAGTARAISSATLISTLLRRTQHSPSTTIRLATTTGCENHGRPRRSEPLNQLLVGFYWAGPQGPDSGERARRASLPDGTYNDGLRPPVRFSRGLTYARHVAPRCAATLSALGVRLEQKGMVEAVGVELFHSL